MYIVENMKYIFARCETVENSASLAFRPVSKARTNKFYVFQQSTNIIYIYIYI